MAGAIAEAAVRIRPDTSGFKNQVESDVSSGVSRVGRIVSSSLKIGAVAAAGGLAVAGAAMVKAGRAAVDLGEQVNKANVVFASSGKAVTQWSGQLTQNFGISSRAALEAAGTFGNMLVPMGFARTKAADMSKGLVELAGDMASFNNASPEDTLEALRSGLAGETEPLRKYGVFLNEARVHQEAVNLGLVKGKEKLDAQAKAAATYAVILKDTKDTQGDFARTSDSLANQQRILSAEMENSSAVIGKALLPAGAAIMRVFAQVAPIVGNLAAKFAGVLGPALETAANFTGKFIDRFSKAKGLKAKVDVVFDTGRDLATDLFERVRDAASKIDWAKVWGSAQGMASGLAAAIANAIDNIDFQGVGDKIVTGLGKALNAGAELVDKIIIPIIDALNRNQGRIADAAATLMAGIFVKLTDPEFWLAHWQLALSVLIAITGGALVKFVGRMGVLAVTVFAKLGDDMVRGIIVGIDKLIPQVGPALIVAWDGLVNIVRRVVPKLAKAVGEGLESAFTALPGIVQKVLKTAFVFEVVGLIGNAVAAATNFVKRVVDAITTTLDPIVNRAKSVFTGIVNTITGSVATAAAAAKSFGSKIVDGVVGTVSGVVGGVKGFFTNAVAAVTGAVAGAVSAATKFAKGIVNAVVDFLRALPGRVKDAFLEAVMAYVGLYARAVSEAARFGKGILTGIVNAITGLAGKVRGFIGEAVGAVSDAIGRARTAATNVGAAIIDGITKGAVGIVGAVQGKFQELWGWIKGAAASARAFASAIGREIVNGIKGGIDALWDGLKGWLSSKVGSLLSGLTPGSTVRQHAAKVIGGPIVFGTMDGFGKELPKAGLTISQGLGKLLSSGPVERAVGTFGKALGKMGVDNIFSGFYEAVKTKSTTNAAASGKAIAGGLYSDDLKRVIIAEAQRLGLDAAAVLSVASHEGLDMKGSGIGDSGHSFGPFQLNTEGELGNQWKGSEAATQAWALSPAGIRFALEGVKKVVGAAKGLEAIRLQATFFEKPLDIPGEIRDASSKYAHYADVVKRLSSGIATNFSETAAAVGGSATEIVEKTTLTPAQIAKLARKVLQSGTTIAEALLNGMDLGDKVPQAFSDAFDQATAKIEKGKLVVLGLGKKIVKPLGDDINKALFQSLLKGGAIPTGIGGKRREAIEQLMEELKVGIDNGAVVLEKASDRLGFNVGIKLNKALVKALAFGGDIPKGIGGGARQLLEAIFPQDEEDFAPVLSKGKLVISNGTDKLITDIRGKINRDLVEKLMTGGEIPDSLKGRGREALEAFMEGARVHITKGQAVLVGAMGKLGFDAGTKLSGGLWQQLIKGGEIPKRLGGATGAQLSSFIEDAKTTLKRGTLTLSSDGQTVGVSIAKSVNAGLIKNLLKGGEIPDGIQGPLRVELEKAMKQLPLVIQNGQATLVGAVKRFGFGVSIPLKGIFQSVFKGGDIPEGELGAKIQKVMDGSVAKLKGGSVILTGEAQRIGLKIGQKIPESMLRAIVLGGAEIPDAIGGKVREALERARSVVASKVSTLQAAFQNLTGRIKQTWDAQTDAMIRGINSKYDNMARDLQHTFDEALRGIEATLRERTKAIEAFRAQLTPAELEINRLETTRATEQRARAIEEAQKRVAEAGLAGDPEALKDAQQQLADALLDERIAQLQVQAEAERSQRDADAQAQLDQANSWAEAERARLADELARRQAQLQAQRDREILDTKALRDEQWKINEQWLADQMIQLQKHPEQWSTIMAEIKKRFGAEFGPQFSTAGFNLGNEFAAGLRRAEGEVRAAAAALARAARGALPRSPAEYGPLSDLGAGWEPGEIVGDVFAAGIARSAGKVATAMGAMLGPVNGPLSDLGKYAGDNGLARVATTLSWADESKTSQAILEEQRNGNELMRQLLAAVSEPGGRIEQQRVDAALAAMLR